MPLFPSRIVFGTNFNRAHILAQFTVLVFHPILFFLPKCVSNCGRGVKNAAFTILAENDTENTAEELYKDTVRSKKKKRPQIKLEYSIRDCN